VKPSPKLASKILALAGVVIRRGNFGPALVRVQACKRRSLKRQLDRNAHFIERENMKSSRVDTWVATVPDRAGALAAKLKALAASGANLELIIARRAGDESGKSLVFVTPLKGAKEVGAAGGAGFTKSGSLHTLRAEGPDKPGAAGRVTAALADHGLNLRGFSAAAIGKKFICYIALDKEGEAVKAARVLRDL
jgi:prephenate dehydratase